MASPAVHNTSFRLDVWRHGGSYQGDERVGEGAAENGLASILIKTHCLGYGNRPSSEEPDVKGFEMALLILLTDTDLG
jgi:hypothetical protein